MLSGTGKISKSADTFFQAIAAGIMIGVGGTVCLSCDNKYFGAVIFAVGLLSIVVFKLNLYTGKVGYILDNKPSYILKVLLILAGNATGTFITASALRLTRIYSAFAEKASALCSAKLNDNFLSAFILSVFCGLLMYTAVEGYRRCVEKGLHTPAAFIVIMPVVTFILAGFNHSIADMFYVFLDGITLGKLLYLLTVALGNAAGGLLLPLLFLFKSSHEK